MKQDNFSGWQDVEWAGYDISICQRVCRRNLAGQFAPYEQGRRHLIKGRSNLWDTRFNANDEENVILGDVQEYNDLMASNGGIGILVADTQANF